MAEPEVATKAPESDAMEEIKEAPKESLIPGDTPVAQGSSSLGVSCFLDEDLVLLLTMRRSIVSLTDQLVSISKDSYRRMHIRRKHALTSASFWSRTKWGDDTNGHH